MNLEVVLNLLLCICSVMSYENATIDTQSSNSTDETVRSSEPTARQTFVLEDGKNSFTSFVIDAKGHYTINISTNSDSNIFISIFNVSKDIIGCDLDGRMLLSDQSAMVALCYKKSPTKKWETVIHNNWVTLMGSKGPGFHAMATRLFKASESEPFCGKNSAKYFKCKHKPYCISSALWCDGNKNCEDFSDEKCACDLPGIEYKEGSYYPTSYKRTYKVAGFSLAIVVSFSCISGLVGYCFYHSEDDEIQRRNAQARRRRQIRREDSQLSQEPRRLDPLLDHPPSYEDVLKWTAQSSGGPAASIPRNDHSDDDER